jgi:dTDP-4-amino-4,6-dideoxygalactose transaminase
MDPNKLGDYLNKRYALCSMRSAMKPKAVIPVHLFGQTADMDPIIEIARRYGLFVIEDACQAHGALYKGRPAGSIGDAGCFSFYPGKNLGAYGETGTIVTDNTELATKIQMLRDHGQSKKYHHDIIGWNARMDGFQGAVLSVKLKHLSTWNEARRQHAQKYNDLLSGVEGIQTPRETEYSRPIYHLYAIRAQKRDDLIAFLTKRDITCGIHYPIPIHLQKAYRYLVFKKGSFPVSERCAREFVSLPMFPELTNEQIEYVGTEIKHFYEMQ